ncbi:undecaprenyl-phosphate glucose phosphotransferase [Psychroflexus torquis ATCC 700755]|uniref:Undecaprenyl-phosphate glucose phosphotransferase n=1 Tax=Psychroflexus torquis (strain ATCC 700755 / CIP 106069 / ACAM 623) TaxID=313595 RepID=K4IIH4_PSYTT|nr:undecaprenyl-phosphate glucose phosphotransferase [Psychroflexus torquis]AFU68886.1 undecaprenyl-phosphate glucose phosphotransferase [Psychroflexus torquis ATCC 700755]
MASKTGRYSTYIRPASYLIDIVILIFFAAQFNFDPIVNATFFSYIIITWILLSIKSNFYEIYRYTKVIKLVSLTFLQAIIFTLIVFAFFGFYFEYGRESNRIFLYLAKSFGLILFIKITVHHLLKSYRKDLGGNYRITVIIGDSLRTRQLNDFFKITPEYGYKCLKVFNLNNSKTQLSHVYDFILENKVDEIYCSMAEVDNIQLNQIVDFADNNLKVLKFLPDNKDIYSRKLNYEYYGFLPILSLRKIPFDDPLNKFIKRSLDIIISLLVLFFILSWLTPLLAIIIKIESKGAVFFKQKRNGLDYKEFYCFKFRSMKPNLQADLHQVSKNDKRITKVGRLLRKTSFDELPQFYNVLLGDMSVVGPRPHMVSHTHMYAENVDKFMVRHFIKPGITGLAQVSGYRGEVETDQDIINRVKYDIFYLENWSLLLDLKIVIQTVLNAIKGEKKAY